MNTSEQRSKLETRRVVQVLGGVPVTEGAGVQIKRVFPGAELSMLDPFLLLDAFRSDHPDDYLAGFPPHPHRGFETVTYLLAGRLRHKDNAGHEGVVEPGGVQWMTAGRGIVHSEMPEQEQGLLAGFQLWVNLPAAHKMDAPGYQEYPAAAIPLERRGDDVRIRVIAGVTSQGTRGPVEQPLTDPLYLDVELGRGRCFSESLPEGHNAFVFVIDGPLQLPDPPNDDRQLQADELAVLSSGVSVTAVAGVDGARFLLVAGLPLREPVARGGPFVMNTREEIRQAEKDFAAGRF